MADGPTIRLLVQDEGGDGQERTVTLPVVLGRDPDSADVVLTDRMVSRRHARLEGEGGGVVLVDLDSANGTWVGEEQVERRPLAPGEAITVGAHTVRWARIEPPSEAPRPDFGAAWGMVVDDAGLRPLPLAELDAAWVRVTRGVEAIDRALEDARDHLDTHDRVTAALDSLLDHHLARLAPSTIAICAPDRDVLGFGTRVAWLRALPDHHTARASSGLARAARSEDVAPLFLAEDRRVVAEVAGVLRDGVRAFSDHTVRVATLGAERLLTALEESLMAVARYESRLAEHARSAGLVPAEEPPPSDASTRASVGADS